MVSAALTCTLVLAPGLVAIQSAQAQTLTVLYSFAGGSDGAYPNGGLIQDASGNLYGTTSYGGASNMGTVFKVSKSGKETVLNAFGAGTDGCYPDGSVVRDAEGNLYGTTGACGASNFGTVFKLSTTGQETVLHSFTGGSSDGCYPAGGLLRDKAGNLYGTTQDCGASKLGTVFKVSKSGKETVLHSFAGSDGAYPEFTSLLMDTKDNLYGVTQYGGDLSCDDPDGCGTAYMLSPGGTLTVLVSFSGYPTDGCYGFGTVAMDTSDNLYGTTEECGSSNQGIVWKVSMNGAETVLHNFAGNPSDGAIPYAGVIIDGKGNLYGDTYQGGTSNLGAVYELTDGTVGLLHSFAGSDGAYPVGNLIRNAKGVLFGTALMGGSKGGFGTVWKLKP
jgi:uncharacterized repeat protein (TIGR03803 family)